MGNKELKIVAPEGYEIDKTNSTLERIIFKRKDDDRPRSWEEFCKRGFTGEEGYICIDGAKKSSRTKEDGRITTDVGYVGNVQEAKAFVALMQLRQLRKAWVGDWEPDWNDDDYKYVIEVSGDDIEVYCYDYINRCLSFPTEDMAYEFMECFQDLLLESKSLL